ncbi:MAG TPA: FAD:protein FMN transferase [Saprospiraceae bacterium]|nr:FAD:protein FMN transferase [Saprospiraceae bacterium]HMQ84482.1 FAD:protein FMN transferase [Saprospiraceae bacterium]
MNLRFSLCCFSLMLTGVLQAQEWLRFEVVQPKMGTQFRLVFYARDSAEANIAAIKAFEKVDALNAIFSDYEADSEISRLCQYVDTLAYMPVGTDMWRLLQQSDTIYRLSSGAFDLSIGPLSKLWRKAFRQKAFPDSLSLAEAKKRVGFEFLDLSQERQLRFRNKDMRLDAGGIAKGYTADEVLKLLASLGISQALIDAGGDIAAGAPPPGQKAWHIQMAGLGMIPLKHRAIATSGDEYRYLKWDGKRYSHIIDPRNGLGVDHGLQVSVIAPHGWLADALASALSVAPDLLTPFQKRYPDCIFYLSKQDHE